MRALVGLWFFAAFGPIVLACDPVVGGNCASTAVACGNACCGPGSICNPERGCEPAPPSDGGPNDGGPSDGGPNDADARVPSDGATSDGGPTDGGPTDARINPSDGGAPDGAPPDGGGPPSDGGTSDGGLPICPLGTQLCGTRCVDTDSDPSNCGSCSLSCATNEICVSGACSLNCPPPRVVCNNQCVDVQTDPNYCGTCLTDCATNICFSGSCVAPSAGHIVLIGHDFTSPQPGVGRLVGNAVLIPTGNPVRVGTFAERTSAPVQTAVDNALSVTASELGRTYQSIATTPADVTQRLASVDTFLVYPQDLATNAELTSWGSQWRLALDGYVRSGGTIVVVDAGGSHAGTWQVLDSAGLFSVQARTPLTTGSTLTVRNAADSISLNVPLTFPAPANTVTFTTSATEVVVETSSTTPQPAVFHRVIRP